MQLLADWVDVAESVATILAIAIGGLWTYLLFVKRRQRFPRAAVTHAVSQTPLPNGGIVLHVAATIRNSGDVLLSLEYARSRIQQVLPLADDILKAVESGEDPVPNDWREIPWPLLGAREWSLSRDAAEIEPGETDTLDCDFIIQPGVQKVVLYTYVTNRTKRGREIGWSATEYVDIRKRPSEEDPS